MISPLHAIAGRALAEPYTGKRVSPDERDFFNTYVRDNALTPVLVQCADHLDQAVVLIMDNEDASPFIRNQAGGWLCQFCGVSAKVTKIAPL